MEALKQELETYKRALPKLLNDQGKFVLISGDEVVGVYTAYEDALSIGYEKFGIKPFLIKKIESVDCLQYFSRDILCHT